MGRFSYCICFNLTRTLGKNKPFFLAEEVRNKWKNVPSGRKKFCSSKKLKLAFTSCVCECGQAKFYHYHFGWFSFYFFLVFSDLNFSTLSGKFCDVIAEL